MKTTTSKIYSWVPGTRYGKELDVSAVGAELEHLIEESNNNLPAEQVVEKASNPLSPLHHAFEWDDTEAARQHRLEQARHLLKSVRVTITTPKRKEITMRLTVAHETNSPGKHSYTTTQYALSDPELRAEVMAQALRELAAFRRKYAELNELLPIFSIIDRFRRKVSKAA